MAQCLRVKQCLLEIHCLQRNNCLQIGCFLRRVLEHRLRCAIVTTLRRIVAQGAHALADQRTKAQISIMNVISMLTCSLMLLKYWHQRGRSQRPTKNSPSQNFGQDGFWKKKNSFNSGWSCHIGPNHEFHHTSCDIGVLVDGLMGKLVRSVIKISLKRFTFLFASNLGLFNFLRLDV